MDSEYDATLRRLLRRYRSSAIYVFGSRAAEIAARVATASTHAGDADAAGGAAAVAGPAPLADHPHSDVVIGVQPARGTRLTADERVRLTLELEALFAVGRVDLVLLPEANAPLAAEVVRGELLLYADPDEEAETQLYYLRRAGDLAPFYAEQSRDLLETTP